jgi:hypothetical protein
VAARSHPSGRRFRRRSSRQSMARTHSSRGRPHSISRINSRNRITRATVEMMLPSASLLPHACATVRHVLDSGYPDEHILTEQ